MKRNYYELSRLRSTRTKIASTTTNHRAIIIPSSSTRTTTTTTRVNLLDYKLPRNLIRSIPSSARPSSSLQHLHHHHHPHPRTIFTSTTPATSHYPPKLKLINLTKLILLLTTLLGSYGYLSDTRATLHSSLGVPIIRFLSKDDDPEDAHRLAIKILRFLARFHLIRDRPQPKDHILSFQLWGKKFDNPIGLAAGFDKHADAIDGLFDIGFGYVEIGSVTPEPQPGNPKPRMFRIPSTQSIINRYGFNSEGHLIVLSKLRSRLLNYLDHHRHLGCSTILSKYDHLNPVQTAYADSGFTHLQLPNSSSSSLLGLPSGSPSDSDSRFSSIDQVLGELSDQLQLPRSLREGRIFAVNLGKNKTSEPDSIEDFKLGIQRFGHLADVLVINISSPNTPGLRSLQSKESLDRLLHQVVDCRNQLNDPESAHPSRSSPPILVKIAPDLSVQELVDIGTVAKNAKIDGIIISNTTTSRPPGSGSEPAIHETGGLSGPPLKPLSLRALSVVHSATSGTVPLVGCGGISSAEDVLEYGKAGASFVELYSALTYKGVGLVRELKDGLVDLLEHREGGKRWEEIVGSSVEGIDLDRLIRQEELERKQDSKRDYDQQVRSIRGTIQEIERRIERIGRHQRETDDRLAVVVGTKTSRSTTDPDDPSSSITTPQALEPKDHPPPDPVQSERGILAGWRQVRRDEIDRNDFKRVV